MNHQVADSRHTWRGGGVLAMADAAIPGVTILAILLGGSTQLWQKATVFAVCALIMVASGGWPHQAPLAGSREGGWALALVALIVLSFAAFLPAAWFSMPFRDLLVGEYELELAPTVTVQPWVTFQNILLLSLTITWAVYLTRRCWVLPRSTVLSIYFGGLLLLILADLALTISGGVWPLGQTPHRTGFFPNRNQTANVIALGGVGFLALTFQRRQRWNAVRILWAGGYVSSVMAVAVTGSRAGPVLLFGGSLIWLLWSAWGHRRTLTLGLSFLLLSLTAFSVFGGQTLNRFFDIAPGSKAAVPGGRRAIQREARRLISAAPWVGVGLGNFSAWFGQYREPGSPAARALHPESDWLWLTAETGFPGLGLVLFAAGVWLRHKWPKRTQPQFRLSAALIVVVIAFCVHGLLDVSGHRMGAVWPVIFLMSQLRTDAMRYATRDRAQMNLLWTGQRIPNCCRWRLAGYVMAAISGLWLASAVGMCSFPSSADLDRVRTELNRPGHWREPRDVVRLVQDGLRYSPLDWELYFHRALALAALASNNTPVVKDFGRARFLEPRMVAVPFAEGRFWLTREPLQTLPAWRCALERAGTNKASWYRSMVREAAQAAPRLRDELRAFALADPELLFVFLEHARSQEILVEVERVLREDPRLERLSPVQQRTLLWFWAQSGEHRSLLEAMRAHPEWMQSHWMVWAEARARDQRWREACRTVESYLSPPSFPQIKAERRSAAEWRAFLLTSTNDFVAGYACYRANMDAGSFEDASIMLRKLANNVECPGWLVHLCAQREMELGRWKEAWALWRRLLPSLP